MPERLSVDDGREARSLREAVEKGLCSEQEYQSFKGKEYEQHLRDQAMAKVARAKVAREVSQTNAEGINIRPEELGAHDIVLAPLTDQVLEQTDPAGEEGEQGEPKQTGASQESAKELIDAYGAAVRAGALTPQPKDEAHFRSLAGLPQVSDSTAALWKKQGNTRQPVTLAKADEPRTN